MSSLRSLSSLLLVPFAALAGCGHFPADTGHHDLLDSVFGQRHTRHVEHHPAPGTMLALAQDVTQIEDEIRRDGSITVKEPDVWGDANLMHFLQEYESVMAPEVDDFKESLQAFVARTDQMTVTSSTAIGIGASEGATVFPQTQSTDSAGTSTVSTSINLNPQLEELSSTETFVALKNLLAQPVTEEKGIGLEPTEVLRQHSTYITVNQALRRRNIGGDNARAAGYGLYRFRVPVSILPGRETRRGYMAVANFRATLQIDQAHLENTFPRLAIAEMAEQLAPLVRAEILNPRTLAPAEEAELLDQITTVLYKNAEQARAGNCRLEELLKDTPVVDRVWTKNAADQLGVSVLEFAQIVMAAVTRGGGEAVSVAVTEDGEVRDMVALGPEVLELDAGIDVASRELKTKGVTAFPISTPTPSIPAKLDLPRELYSTLATSLARKYRASQTIPEREVQPKLQEVQLFLVGHLEQVHNALDYKQSPFAANIYESYLELIAAASQEIESGGSVDARIDGFACQDVSAECRSGLLNIFHSWADRAVRDGYTYEFAQVAGVLGMHMGVADRNVKRLVEDLYKQDKISEETCMLAETDAIYFFAPHLAPELTLSVWRTVIEQGFPIHVFALDPPLEEQNALDALSRRRDLQLALAIGVANGSIGWGQQVQASRALGLDLTTVDLNRTITGYTAGNDTFGWYFRPRIQTPPTESSNIAAFARTVWSTGPTENYDLKHRELEPGIRECEVLVVMPSFATQVNFEVTTNWERVNRPGITKRSYEEMIELGRRVQTAQHRAMCVNDAQCYRPGDQQRLISRLEQLEKMLALQTHTVSIPFHRQLTATDLFDQGDVQLAPQIHDYYGLQYLEAQSTAAADFFVTGKNFHPTLTHVVVGGKEVHSVATADRIASNLQGFTPSTDVEVLSRELIRVRIRDLNGKLSKPDQFIVRVATPAGLSNPLAILVASKPAQPAKLKGFHLASPPEGFFCYDPANGFDPVRSRIGVPGQISYITYDGESPPYIPEGRYCLCVDFVANDATGRLMSMTLPAQPMPCFEVTRVDGHALAFDSGDLGLKIANYLSGQVVSGGDATDFQVIAQLSLLPDCAASCQTSTAVIGAIKIDVHRLKNCEMVGSSPCPPVIQETLPSKAPAAILSP